MKSNLKTESVDWLQLSLKNVNVSHWYNLKFSKENDVKFI
jgi:hypothetical protein